MDIEAELDRLHSRARGIPLLLRFAELNRVLLSVGFFAPGLSKLLGLRFTRLPIEDPVGFFFEALYRAGLYWRFLGAMQVLAAVLVLIPVTAHLGALLFLAILTNITLITLSLPFDGTPVVALMMLLASVYLVCWDYPRWKTLMPLKFKRPIPISVMPRISMVERTGYLLAAFGGWSITAVMRGLAGGFSAEVFTAGNIVVLIGGGVFLWGCLRNARLNMSP